MPQAYFEPYESVHDGRRWVENAGIHINRCRKIRDRKVRGEEAPYSQPEIKQLRKDYSKVISGLEFQSEAASLTELQKRQQIVVRLTDKLIRGEPFSDKIVQT